MTVRDSKAGPIVPDGLHYALDEEEIFRLWRAQQAAQLLSMLDNEAVYHARVSHDSLAAVAEYVAQDMLDILTKAQRRGAAKTNPKGPELI